MNILKTRIAQKVKGTFTLQQRTFFLHFEKFHIQA